MAYYLFQATFTPQAMGKMVEGPQDRAAVFGSLLEKMGGKLHNFFYSLGESDVMVLFEVPEDTVAATIFAVVSAGHLINARTTKLFTNEEAMAALQKAGSLKVAPPS